MNQHERKLIQVYLRAETDIINEIARLRSLGLADYHAVAALRRVRRILAGMQSEAWTYAPKAIEEYFYANRPELRIMPTSPEMALRAYESAAALTIEQVDIVSRLTFSLMASLENASETVVTTLEEYLVGRRDFDLYRSRGIAISSEIEAEGSRKGKVDRFVKALQRDGITAFEDKAGRKWRLHTYASMVTRTTTRQAEVLSVLTKDPTQDLYTIKGAADPCGVCAAYQDRVYSKSGEDPRFPPLSDIFGKINPEGPNTLQNTWLNIHPNCRCAILPWYEQGKTQEEIDSARRFSDPRLNPYDKDPRTEQAIKAYRRQEDGRRKWMEDYKQWERYRVTIPDKTPKTFNTFMRHKALNDDKYKAWGREYRAANEEARDA